MKQISLEQAKCALREGKKVYWGEDSQDHFYMEDGVRWVYLRGNHINDETITCLGFGMDGNTYFIEETKEDNMRKVTKEEARQHLKNGGVVYWNDGKTELTYDGCNVTRHREGSPDWSLAGGLNLSTDLPLYIKTMTRTQAFEALVDGKKVVCILNGKKFCELWIYDNVLEGEFLGEHKGKCGEGIKRKAFDILISYDEFELYVEPEPVETNVFTQVLEALENCDISSAKCLIKEHI